jgi:transposase
MGFEPDVVHGRPCDPPGCAESTNPSLSCVPPLSLIDVDRKGEVVRCIGLDVHRDFCEVAIAEDGRVRSAGRIKTSVEALELFAESLGFEDAVALEATSGSAKIAKLIEPHVARVVVANTRKLAAISQAKAKTDRLDARTLARMLASGYLDEVWAPDERTRALRRLTGRRARLVRARTRAKNEVHGVLARNLWPPVVHLFSKAGRSWLARLELPADELLTLEGCLRQIDFLDGEIRSLEAVLARHALESEEIQRLMTIPGVNVLTAAAFMASVGDIGRFHGPRKLVSYRTRPEGAPVRQRARPPRPHLQGRRRRGPAHARRGRLEGGAHPRAAARLLRAGAVPPRPPGRRHRDRAQAGRAVLAPAHPRRGLRLPAPGDDAPQDPPARAGGRRPAA